MFIKVFTLGPIATHSYLIACRKTKEAAVIDAPQGVAPKILKEVEKQGFVVRKILITHSHWDHIAGADELKKATKAPLYVHETDKRNLEEPGSDYLRLPIPVPPTTVDGFLREDEEIHLGKLLIKVIETPGHTNGSVCLWLPEQETLFSGDTLFKRGVGRLDLPTGQHEKMLPSLRKLEKLPSETRVYPGHGSKTTIGDELEQLANWKE